MVDEDDDVAGGGRLRKYLADSLGDFARTSGSGQERVDIYLDNMFIIYSRHRLTFVDFFCETQNGCLFTHSRLTDQDHIATGLARERFLYRFDMAIVPD